MNGNMAGNGYIPSQKVKVKFLLEQAMKAQSGGRGMCLTFI